MEWIDILRYASIDMSSIAVTTEPSRFAWLCISDERRIIRPNRKEIRGGQHRWYLLSRVSNLNGDVPIVIRTRSEGFKANKSHSPHEHFPPLGARCKLDENAYLGDEAYLINHQWLMENFVLACPEIEQDEKIQDYFDGVFRDFIKNPRYGNRKLTDE